MGKFVDEEPKFVAPKPPVKPRVKRTVKKQYSEIIINIAWHYWDTWFKKKVPKGRGKMWREYVKLCEIIPEIKEVLEK